MPEDTRDYVVCIDYTTVCVVVLYIELRRPSMEICPGGPTVALPVRVRFLFCFNRV